jgi:hypothetical protein
MRPRLGLCLAGATLLLIAGCGPKNFENENDKLRRANMELKREIEQMRDKLDRQSGRIQTLQSRLAGPSQTQPLRDAPTLSQIKLGRYSGSIDNDGDGTDDTVRLYVRTLDQRGRMLPVAAKAKIQVVHIPEEGEPRRLASKNYNGKAFDEAYRSSFTGEHYTLEVKLPDSVPETVDEVTVKVTLEHLSSGATFSKQGTYRLSRE